MSRQLIPFFAAAILLTSLASGCGSDNGADSGTYTVGDRTYTVVANTTVTVGGISRPQFVARANKFCREAWETILDNFAKHSSWQDSNWDRERRFDDAVRISLLAGIDFHIFDNFRILGAPPGETEGIEEMIGPMQIAVERGRKLHFSTVEDVVSQFEGFNRRARAYGLEDCVVDEAHLRPIEDLPPV